MGLKTLNCPTSFKNRTLDSRYLPHKLHGRRKFKLKTPNFIPCLHNEKVRKYISVGVKSRASLTQIRVPIGRSRGFGLMILGIACVHGSVAHGAAPCCPGRISSHSRHRLLLHHRGLPTIASPVQISAEHTTFLCGTEVWNDWKPFDPLLWRFAEI